MTHTLIILFYSLNMAHLLPFKTRLWIFHEKMVYFFLKIAISGYISIGEEGGFVRIYAHVADCTCLFTDYSFGL